MNHDSYGTEYIREILKGIKTIAMVGASDNPARPSFLVLKYLISRGYRVFPVNPGKAGREFAGQTVYASLAEIPEPIDMVEVFRAPEFALAVTDAALALTPLPKVLWMQLGVRDDQAAARAEAKGLKVIMNRCPKIEYGRLSGEISWTGVNSGLISSKRPALAARGFQKLTLDRNN